MEAKQLWLYFSIVLEGIQLDEGTYQARGICLGSLWEMFQYIWDFQQGKKILTVKCKMV